MNIERSFQTAKDIHSAARALGQRIIRMKPIKSPDGLDGFVVMSVPEPAPVEVKPRRVREIVINHMRPYASVR